jgi:PKD repeat protein
MRLELARGLAATALLVLTAGELEAVVPISLSTPALQPCGLVEINGTTSTSASRLAWDWGDGTQSASFFPARHKYRAAGTYQIVVTVTDGSGDHGTATREVTIPALTPTCGSSVEVTPSVVALQDGVTSQQLTVRLVDGSGVPLLSSPANTRFTSSDARLVGVDPDGLVTGTGFGQATVSVSTPLGLAQVQVLVGRVRAVPALLVLAPGDTHTVSVEATAADGSQVPLTQAVTFGGGSASATVNARSGEVTAVRPPSVFGETVMVSAVLANGRRSSNQVLVRVLPDSSLATRTLEYGNIAIGIPTASLAGLEHASTFEQFDVPRLVDLNVQLQWALTGQRPFDGGQQILVIDPASDDTLPCGLSGNPVRLGASTVDPGKNCAVQRFQGNRPRWGIIFHELGHNVTLASGRFQHFVNAASTLSLRAAYVEGLASAVGMFTGQVMIQRAPEFGISPLITSQMMAEELIVPPARFLNAYESGGAKYASITPDAIDGILQALIADHGLQVLSGLFTVFDGKAFPFQIATEAHQATFFVAALSAAANRDLRPRFQNAWGFPIDDAYFGDVIDFVRGFIGAAQGATESRGRTPTIVRQSR